jgi:hypothetical protein
MCFNYFKSKSLLSIFLGVTAILTSCQKNLPPIFKHGESGNDHVFVAGYESNGIVNVAKYWIDGQEIKLSDGTNDANANSIFVSNDDVYIAGSDSGAVYWKNSREIRLSAGNAFSVFVSGNDVYVGGSDGPHAAYWKNGTEVLLETNTNFGIFAVNSIFVSGNDVYAAGYDNRDAVYWKNGVEINLTAVTIEFEGLFHANSIYVSGNDVYVVGYGSSSGSPFSQVCYWKNGVLVRVSNGQGNSVFVSGSHVYIAGTEESDPSYIPTAAYWKDGNLIPLPRSAVNSFANSMFVSGNDVYVAGYEFVAYQVTYGVYWKNGIETKLTDGTHAAVATSIFIK